MSLLLGIRMILQQMKLEITHQVLMKYMWLISLVQEKDQVLQDSF